MEQLQATWSPGHVHKHSSGTLPFPVLQPHEIFRLLDSAYPFLSPSASALPLHHLWLSLSLFLESCRGGKTSLQTGGGYVLNLPSWPRGRAGAGIKPNLLFPVPSPPHNKDKLWKVSFSGCGQGSKKNYAFCVPCDTSLSTFDHPGGIGISAPYSRRSSERSRDLLKVSQPFQ